MQNRNTWKINVRQAVSLKKMYSDLLIHLKSFPFFYIQVLGAVQSINPIFLTSLLKGNVSNFVYFFVNNICKDVLHLSKTNVTFVLKCNS